VTPGPHTFATKAAADRWLAGKRADLDRGTDLDERAGNRPLREWWPGYLATLDRIKLSTRVGYERAWRLRVEPRFGSTPVRRIRPSHLDERIATMTAEGVSAATLPLGASTLLFGNGVGEHRRYRVWRRDSWDKATERAGIEATPHDLRATAASLLIAAGASVKDVQNHRGHASELTTLRLSARVHCRSLRLGLRRQRR
jgi:integrase